MNDDEDEGQDDFSLWERYTQDIKPIERYKPEKAKKTSSSKKPATQTKLEKIEVDVVLQSSHVPPNKQKDKQIDARTAQRLKRGQIPIEARIDLHGMYQKDARAALTRFLLNSHAQGMRCVLVVTGKGKLILDGEHADENTPGVIKRAFKGWLKEEPLDSIVLKAQVSQIKDGGEGAYYVLLRKKR